MTTRPAELLGVRFILLAAWTVANRSPAAPVSRAEASEHGSALARREGFTQAASFKRTHGGAALPDWRFGELTGAAAPRARVVRL
jgi:hypothetical protein